MQISPLQHCDMFTAGYPAASSTTHNYSQSTQAYGASGYESTPTAAVAAAAAAAPAASQSYGSQPGYTAQSAYPGYGQQAAPTAPQRYACLLGQKQNVNYTTSSIFLLNALSCFVSYQLQC